MRTKIIDDKVLYIASAGEITVKPIDAIRKAEPFKKELIDLERTVSEEELDGYTNPANEEVNLFAENFFNGQVSPNFNIEYLYGVSARITMFIGCFSLCEPEAEFLLLSEDGRKFDRILDYALFGLNPENWKRIVPVALTDDRTDRKELLN